MRWLFAFMGLVAVLGISRLTLEAPRPVPVDVAHAQKWAKCLAEEVIPVNTQVSVRLLPDMTGDFASPAGEALVFEPSTETDIALDTALPEPQVKAPAEGAGAGQTSEAARFTVPAGQVLPAEGGNFLLRNGAVEILYRDGRYALKSDEPIRFGPVAAEQYDLRLGAPMEGIAGSRAGTFRLKTATEVPQRLDREHPITVQTLQPIAVKPWLEKTASTLLPERASGQKGLGDLAIEARRPGVEFGEKGLALSACALTEGAPEAVIVGVAEAKPLETGAATVLLSLPGAFLPLFETPWQEVQLAVAGSGGNYAAFGGFTAVARGWAAIIALALVALLFFMVSSLCHTTGRFKRRRLPHAGAPSRSEWVMGLFVGDDGDPSLSLFQIFIWTMVTVWGLSYSFLVTGSLLNLTQEMMWLLAIAGTGSVLARWVAARSPGGSTSLPAGAAPAGAIVAAEPKPIEFWQMLSTKGRFDLLKLQLFIFTLLIAAYVVWRILDTAAFPALDVNTLLLLGVSQGTYIGGKVAGATALGRAQTLKLELDLQKEEVARLEAEAKKLADDKAALDAHKAADALDDTQAKTLANLPGQIKVQGDKVTAAKAKVAQLEKDLEKIVKEELGLIPT